MRSSTAVTGKPERCLTPCALDIFPEFAQKWGDPGMAAIMANPSCNGPLALGVPG